MSEDREAAEGRVRRTRPLLAGAIGLALLAMLPIAGGLLRDDGPTEDGAAAPSPADGTGPVASALHGRLVYLAQNDRGGGRLWIVDLGGGLAARGPAVPAVDELVAAGPGRRWLVLLGVAAGERVAYLLRDLATGTEPVELARGRLIAQSADGSELLVVNADSAGGTSCGELAYRLRRIFLRTGRDTPTRSDPPCGAPVSVGSLGDVLVVSLRRQSATVVVTVPPRAAPSIQFRRLAHVAVSSDGSFLFVHPAVRRASAPIRPTGPLLYWPGGGTPRPVVTGRRLFARRVVAWSPFGRFVVIDGTIEGERTLWRIDVAAGTAASLFPPDTPSFDPARAGATFDDGGAAFGATPGGLLAQLPSGEWVDVLPAGAPAPVGPVAWLP